MKKLFTLTLAICCLLNAVAQEPAGKSINEKGVSATKPKKNESQKLTAGNPIGGIIVKGGKNPGGSLLISLDGGILSPGTATKNGANLGNLSNFNINAYLPLTDFGGATGGVISKTFGVNIGGGYFSGNQEYGTSNYTPYNITGQSSNPTISAKGSGSPKQAGFKTEAGVQANFSFGKITVSPIVNAAYFSLKQQAFSIVQNSSVNGQNKEYNLYTQAETQTNSFALIPKLRLSYFPGRFGFFIEGSYISGPGIKNETTVFKPQGTPNDKGFYNTDQMMKGTNEAISKNTKFNGLGIQAGIQMALGRIGRIRGAGKNTETGNGASLLGGALGGNIEVPNPSSKGHNEKGIKRSENAIINGKATELAQIKKDYLDGLMVSINGEKLLNPKLFKLVTSSADLVGQKVSIKKAGKQYAYLGNQDELVQVISIPSARAQECTDCKETDNCDNSTHFDCCCNGGYCWCLLCIEKSSLQKLPDDRLVPTNGDTTASGNPRNSVK